MRRRLLTGRRAFVRVLSRAPWILGLNFLAVVGCGKAQDVFLGGLVSGGDGDLGNTGGDGGDSGAGGTSLGGGMVGPEICSDEPIDETRLRILEGALGFGRNAGSLDEGTCIVNVSSVATSGPGSLREVLESDVPAWVRFNVNRIVLDSDINVRSNKVLDGSGSDVFIERFGLRMGAGVSNVVVHDIAFVGSELAGTGGSSAASDDAILIEQGARDIWIDHCDFTAYADGTIDILSGATNITVSYNHFFDQRRVMLIGNENGGAEDELIRVTLHHNWYELTETYHPRLRRGWVHSFNNYLQQWESFGSGSSENGQLASEQNVYEAGSNLDATITEIADDGAPGNLRSDGDVAINGAVLVERNPDLVFDPAEFYEYEVDQAGSELIDIIISEAGTR